MNKKAADLNALNNETDSLLTKENQRYMTDLVCYLRLKNVDDYQLEVVRNDVTEMLLTAQNEGKEARDVIGEDYKAFCDEILQNVRVKSKAEVIWEYASVSLYALGVFCGISFLLSQSFRSLVNHLLHGEDYSWTWGITAGDLLSWTLLAVAAFLIVLWAMATPSPPADYKPPIIKGFLWGAGVMIACIVLAYVTQTYLGQVIFQVPVPVVLAVYLVWIAVHFFGKLSHRQRKEE